MGIFVSQYSCKFFSISYHTKVTEILWIKINKIDKFLYENLERLKVAHKTSTNKLTHFEHVVQATHVASGVINTNLAALNKNIQNIDNKCSFPELLTKSFKHVICSGSWPDYNPLKYLKGLSLSTCSGIHQGNLLLLLGIIFVTYIIKHVNKYMLCTLRLKMEKSQRDYN